MSPIRYMAENRVAANLLMAFFVVGGLLAVGALTIEVFPEIDLDRISVSLLYPGASPAEVEEGICEPVEEAVQGLDGIRRVQSTAVEGSGSVMVEVLDSADPDKVLQDVKSAVDRIVTFPVEAERAVVSLLTNRRAVLSVVVFGELDEHTLRAQGERLRDDLLALPEITQLELSGIPNYEISIEIDEETLRSYGITLDQVAATVRSTALDLPGGSVKTDAGEILLRTKERRYFGREYENIIVVSKPDGTTVRLGDIARVRDTFEETDESARYGGKPAAIVEVFRIGDQSPSEISEAVEKYLEQRREEAPKALGFAIWNDRSEILEDRLDLLLKNAFLGLLLVVIVLGLFLRLSLAGWVTLGIPISILGGILVMPWADASINMISLFAFILVLGIVVDDAIVVGENTYTHRGFDKSGLDAAVDAATEVGRPVTFSILTTVAAFAPLLFVSGTMGKFMRSVPLIVIPVLLVSLIESLFVLPAHLSHKPKERRRGPGAIYRLQDRVSALLTWVIERPYSGTIRLALRHRYTTLAAGLALLALTVGLFAGGHIKMVFLPELEGDVARAQLELPFGAPAKQTEAYLQRIVRAGQKVIAEYDAKLDGGGTNLRGIFSIVGSQMARSGPRSGGSSSGGSHLGEVAVFLKPSDERNVDASEFAERWRMLVGEIPGAEKLEYETRLIHAGAPIGIQLAHTDFGALEAATERLKARLHEYPGLHDIADSYELGKRELKLKLKPEARALGLTARDLASQVRSAFYGAEALRMQRGRNEIKVMVRYPPEQRRSLANVEEMRIRTPRGGEIPFAQAATIAEGRGYSIIQRTDRKRTVTITAKAHAKQANPAEVIAELKSSLLPQLEADYPGLTFDLEGEQRERAESMRSLRFGFFAALGLIYCLLAIPFRSYGQPLIIMSAIPFGLIGAVFGHLLLGFNISMMSVFGVVALTGVVVNDSLVLIDFINRARRGELEEMRRIEGAASGGVQADVALMHAVMEGCKRRFRPILLTTLTTFFALVPMLAETSIQARFLIPMAVSLAFGVLFATFITLVLIPTLYVVLEDLRKLGRWFVGRPVNPSTALRDER
jgi:multidrug efflux pump subunit AcrB